MARPTGGYIKLHRKILSGKLRGDGHAREILNVITLKANWTPGTEPLKRQMVYVDRSQCATSLDEIVRETGFSKTIVVDRLEKLERLGTIKQTVSKDGRIITVCNYERYQPNNTDGDTDDDTDDDTGASTAGSTAPSTDGSTHIEEKRRKNRNSFPQKILRQKKKAELSPTSKAKIVVSDLVRTLREQLAAGEAGPRNAKEAEATARTKLSAEAWELLRTEFASWDQFARAHVKQSKGGFEQVFERNLAEKFRAQLQAEATNRKSDASKTPEASAHG